MHEKGVHGESARESIFTMLLKWEGEGGNKQWIRREKESGRRRENLLCVCARAGCQWRVMECVQPW